MIHAVPDGVILIHVVYLKCVIDSIHLITSVMKTYRLIRS